MPLPVRLQLASKLRVSGVRAVEQASHSLQLVSLLKLEEEVEIVLLLQVWLPMMVEEAEGALRMPDEPLNSAVVELAYLLKVQQFVHSLHQLHFWVKPLKLTWSLHLAVALRSFRVHCP
jgi:hypothetical protein